MAEILEPVPCEVRVRVGEVSSGEVIIIDLTHERDGDKHRTQVSLTPEQFALAVTGATFAVGKVTVYTIKPKEPPA